MARAAGIGGPVATIVFIAGFLLREWRNKRKDDREDKTTERSTESGIVETTKQALEIVRGQMAQFERDLATEVRRRERQKQEYEEKIEELKQEHEEKIEELKARIESLEEENERLKARR